VVGEVLEVYNQAMTLRYVLYSTLELWPRGLGALLLPSRAARAERGRRVKAEADPLLVVVEGELDGVDLGGEAQQGAPAADHNALLDSGLGGVERVLHTQLLLS